MNSGYIVQYLIKKNGTKNSKYNVQYLIQKMAKWIPDIFTVFNQKMAK